MSEPIKLGVVGASGRMGQAIINLLNSHNNQDMILVGAVDTHDVHLPAFAASTVETDDKKELVKKADVIIDFSTIESSVETAGLCAESGCALVIGTTGFSSDDRGAILRAAEKCALLWSPNMSVGVNLLFHLTSLVAGWIGKNYDIEIIESHHNKKVDSPSGTAVKLKEEVLAALDQNEDTVIYGRHGQSGQRPKGEVGVHAVRGGSIVGEHTVLFAGEGENIKLEHTALSRDTFASGAIQAARFLARDVSKKPGYYTMSDLLRFD